MPPLNLVTNSGFETGNFTGWTVFGANTASSVNIGVDSLPADVHSGSFGAFAGNAVTTTLSQTIVTVPGTTYTVSFFLDVYQADATNGFFTANFGNNTFVNLQEPTQTDVFTQFTASVVATTAATTLTFSFNDPGGFFGLDDVSVVNPAACFCRGTLILTDRGEVAVETLAIGDCVVTLSGLAQPIRWIGRRSYRGRSLSGRKHLFPVLIRAGVLGDGLPRRDLRVSPLHAMFLDSVLVPAWALIDGRAVVREQDCREVDYFHVELDRHDVIFAEGAATETFLDDDSRWLFENAREYAELYPDAEPPGPFYAPRRDQGFELQTIRRTIGGRTLDAV